MKPTKRQIQPVSEARFRVILILMSIVLVMTLLLVIDGSTAMVGLIPVIMMIPSLRAPDSFLLAVDQRIPLLRIRIPLLIAVVIAFLGCLALVRINQNILAAILFLFSGIGFFVVMLGEAFRNRNL